MKKPRLFSSLLPGLAAALLLLNACNKETAVPAAPAPPASTVFTTLRMGTVVAQGGVMSGGTIAIVKAADGSEHVQFNADFYTDFHTGSLGIYLAKSNALVRNQRAADPASVVRVGTITQSGAQLLPITGTSAGFSHVILHCDPAQYNFGAAPMQ
ncbi:hypothetical protein [Hymenobacter sp.]|uniref:hypothetical protein n=1 Tax=Hymenobacter sp. TaxID=1898978 RepID=UPI00286B70D8|nr:hypothetical protein [Hymenobacter sp.]